MVPVVSIRFDGESIKELVPALYIKESNSTPLKLGDDNILAPANFSHQRCEFFILRVNLIKNPHPPQGKRLLLPFANLR
ncbi:MAG: hypothetical protein A2X34_09830 [Elusimicrobia bacterium GWC2_51_8]|nr:MAG: hypothetical protein A2X33_01915 [Elusimicrobia bacterium GWA2_51_34]OGR61449.1 MAG: hypothetical protein A2X34_09830 [Elusimicrobia bacterium GWC2_51_8]OGR85119.1 MAG: hypothetical protein A2021_09325 [Elusimicrobia bacterium GWF2_52_66]